MSPLLFSPIQLGGITLPNRVVIALCRRLLARRHPSLGGYVIGIETTDGAIAAEER
jgi:hypothetical protein